MDTGEVSLKVRYLVDGQSIFPDQTLTYLPGEKYYVVSPLYPGYDADKQIVSGRIQGDMDIAVNYTLKEWTVSIRYIYPDGTEATESCQTMVKTGESYDITSPPVDGYRPLRQRIAGTNPGRNEQYVVIYVPDTE